MEYTGLPLKKDTLKNTGISHINPTIGHKKHDTIRIILYQDKLKTYNFNNNFRVLLTQICKVNIM